MTISTEIAQMDATAQAALVKKGEVTPIELVEATIERIEKVNPELNAVIAAPLDTPMAAWDRVGRFATYTPLFNATGQPAMSVPLYWSEDGLPIGSHFVGRFGDEATLFRLAAQLEAARPWMNRHPPISAF